MTTTILAAEADGAEHGPPQRSGIPGAVRLAIAEPAPLFRWVAWLALAAYIAATAFIAVRHEPWRDEADAWLVARDASPAMFLRRASLGGTPELWHLMLVPLARSGAAYGSQKVLHLCLAAASVALILFFAPLPRLTRLAAAFSYYFAYEYAIVVRSYALGVLLLLLAAAFYASRREKPWRYAAAVALLANANAHSLIIAAFHGMLYLADAAREGRLRERWKPVLLMLAGGVAAVVQLTNASADRAMTFVRIRWDAPLQSIGEALWPLSGWRIAPLGGVVAFVAISWWVRRDRNVLLFVWASSAALLLLFTFWWTGGLRHSGLLLVILIAAIWMYQSGGETSTTAAKVALSVLTAAFLWGDIATLYMWQLDTRYAFSGSQEIGAFINGHGLSNRIIAGHSETTASALAPYLHHPLWYPGIEEFGTFVTWDRKFDEGLNVPYPEAVHRFRRRYGNRPDSLLILNVRIPDPAAERLRLVYQNRSFVFGRPDERYWLYEPILP